MHFIYVYGGCSPKKYNEYVEKLGLRIKQQSQKYNQLLMEGLVKNGSSVYAISSRPINRNNKKQFFFKGEKDYENGIYYYYVPFINYSVMRNITVFISVFFKILFMHINYKEHVIMCDGLNIAASLAALIASKIRKIKTVGIVTDVPSRRPNNSRVLLRERINLWIMRRFDSYLLLTEYMNAIVNPNNKPYIVLEGHSDIRMRKKENKLEDKNPKKVCFYAGTLRKVYGIDNLVIGFVEANVPDSELHIYGDGDYLKDLLQLSEKYANVKYLGIVPNHVIVQEEMKATLLVNPRPTDADYTKYSFPSKNMEYMASGTPVLTTSLPGMPEEYKKYVYVLEDESANGIKNALREILSQPKEILHEKGKQAKEFVMREKNNIVQAKKVIQMLELLDNK